MQIFVPYKSAIKCAEALDIKRLNNQINEAAIILKAINGNKAWANHPVVKQYKNYSEWVELYRKTLFLYFNSIKNKNNKDLSSSFLYQAKDVSKKADKLIPKFLTTEFCKNFQRRLFTKNPEFYIKKFGSLETTNENWYFDPIQNKIIKYLNGKKI